MAIFQTLILIFFLIYSLLCLILSFYQLKYKKNPFGLTPVFTLLGAFVWGDGLVFGAFWLLIISFCLILNDFLFFLLVFSLFWVVRSLGEMVYWLNQQFSTKDRNPPQTLKFSSLFPQDSIHFAYQIFFQCILGHI